MSAMSSRPVEVGVVLQGGGALGAYECGALIALLELMDDFAAQGREIALKVVTGVSIGSINAACVVGARTHGDARTRLVVEGLSHERMVWPQSRYRGA